ncbi:hypothetical protein BDR03DRAFT_1012181 [Suillus americanus]|nr:hypothetical protein BDR03DRAFT_1012181 [Suillus americanus]
MKPTGDTACPHHIEHAHEINFLMNERAGTQDLDDDDDFTNEVIIVGSDEDEPQHVSTPKVSVKREIQEPTLISHRSIATPTPWPLRTSRAPGLDLLTLISASLDPQLQATRDDECAARTLQTTQLVSISNQL